jgi:chemotaxis protein histidine kinase CheA
MLISKQRHEREKSDAVAKATRLNEEILGGLPQAIFLIDRELIIRAPVSRAAETLLRRRDLLAQRFDKVLETILPPKPFAAAAEFLAKIRAADAPADLNSISPLHDVPVRIAAGEGAVENKFLSFTFRRIVTASDGQAWAVSVSDVSQRVESQREIEELRAYSKAQAACLASLVRVGAERFAGFLRQSDASVNMINAVLKKPARANEAFRAKLDEILREILQIRQQASLMELDTIETMAQGFEEAASTLKRAETLSGSDFLPLAVKLDELFAQLALMRSMTSVTPTQRAAAPAPVRPAEPGKPRVTDNGTEIIEAPKLAALSAEAMAAAAGLPAPAPATRSAPAGGLESALQSMTEHVAQSSGKSVTLRCEGVGEVPASYQGVVKNIALQLIRNSIMHGIEAEHEREATGKPPFGSLRLKFDSRGEQGFHLSFTDDGRGLDAQQLRDTAVAKGMLSAEEAAKLPDRQAIKLIFRKGFSTVAEPTSDVGRGMGMALVRRYVAEAGGKVGLATVLGSQTRFRITLPPVSADGGEEAQVA